MIDKTNIIDLNSYIRISSIKEQFEERCLYVKSEEDFGDISKYTNIIFETSQLKNLFFERLILRDVNHTVINCLASTEIFKENLFDAHGTVVFDNVCCCKNNEILEMVIDYKKSKILVC